MEGREVDSIEQKVSAVGVVEVEYLGSFIDTAGKSSSKYYLIGSPLSKLEKIVLSYGRDFGLKLRIVIY